MPTPETPAKPAKVPPPPPATTVAAAEQALKAALTEESTEPAPLAPSTEEDAPDPIEEASDALDEARRAQNEKDLQRLGRLTLTVLGGIALGAEISIAVGHGAWRTWTAPRQALFLTIALTAAAVGILAVALHGSGGLRRYLIGEDGRFSTSRTQVLIWTVALAFALVFLTLQGPVGGECPEPEAAGADAVCESFVKGFDQLDPTYLLLLGGPFAAAVISGAVTGYKIDEQTLQKVESPEAKLSDLVSNDAGHADLVDLQFFAFNLVGIVVFVTALSQDPTTLPDLPNGLVGLTSLAALAYTGSKAVAANQPVIDSITKVRGKGKIRPGSFVAVKGSNFVPPGADRLEQRTRVRVTFGDTEEPVRPRLKGTRIVNPTTDRLTLRVPMDVTVDEDIDVTVTTAAGIQSKPFRMKIHSAPDP